MSNPVIKFNNASYVYQEKPALKDISLVIKEGEFWGLIGPNGSGKTTLLKAILGLILPVEGSMQIFDCDCALIRCHHRSQIGYLPQKENIDPNFPITVFEAVMMGRYSTLGLFRRPGKADREIVLEAIKSVDMLKFVDSPLGRLSGGQQQRVLIARALAQQPKILLLDEPTTGIDSSTQHNLIELIRHIHKELNLTILFVTHDINMISPFVDKVAILNSEIFAVGTPAEVLTKSTLTSIYGQEVIIMPRENHPFVILGDHHG